MTPQEYCQYTINPIWYDSSSLYHSLRFLPRAQKQALTVLYAFFYEVSEIRHECHNDFNLAQLKLHWWREELANTFVGETPRHPICRGLSKLITRYQLPFEHFQTIITQLSSDFAILRYQNFSILENYCQSTHGTLNLLATQVCGYQDDTTLEVVKQLGVAQQLIHILRTVRRDILHNKIYIPLEDLAHFNLQPSNLLTQQEDDTVQALFAYQATRIRAYYHDAFRRLAVTERFTQRHHLIRAQLSLATLQEIETDGYRLFKQHIRLTPLRKLWISWRSYWQVKKGLSLPEN
jgi:phytoene synthase